MSKPFPRRLSANQDHPDFHPDAWVLDLTFDGVLQHNVVHYDLDKSEITRIKSDPDANGMPLPRNAAWEWEYETLKGNIELKWKEIR
jgi:hypothetical protein